MSVIIYSDLNSIYEGKADILVNKIEEYTDTYCNILNAIYQKSDLVVIVRNNICLKYLYKMKLNYSEQIQLKTFSPKEIIQNQVRINIPQYITDDDIVNSKLLKNVDKILFNSNLSFEDNLLIYYLGNYFTNIRFPYMQIYDFLKNFDNSCLKKEGNIILKKVYERKIKLWKESCKNKYEQNILNAFIIDYKELIVKLSEYSILKKYPKEIICDVVGVIANDFLNLNLSIAPFIPEGVNDNKVLKRNIGLYLNNQILSELSFEEIINKVECLSGLLYEELQYVYKLLDNNRNIIDISIQQKVRQKFKNGLMLDVEFNEKLSKIISPPRVVKPQNIDSIEQWLTWALESYLPYKFWMESNDIYDEDMDNYSTMFGDWIFNHYDSLISDGNKMLYNVLTNLSNNISQDEVSIIIMIDNFNYKYVPLCIKHFNDNGFSTTANEAIISMIPTETSVSKVAFFTGQPYKTKDISYDNMTKEWEDFIGGEAYYLSDIGKLDELAVANSKLYILNYLCIDKILHDNQDSSALSVGYKIQEELKAMINKIISFANKFNIENRIKIYFISDHGSTKISDKQENLINPKYYKSKSDDYAYRFIELKDKAFNIYKDSIGHLCYVIDRNIFGLKENYLIARSYGRFIETSKKFFVHGGISPEETIVPLLKFERINTKLVEPEILLRNKDFRYATVNSIKITIKNYNEYALHNVEIYILNSNIRWEYGKQVINKIEKESSVDITLEKVRILKSSKNSDAITLKMVYDFIGNENEITKEFLINIKSIQESNFNFDDLF
jgi:hypothetical protein